MTLEQDVAYYLERLTYIEKRYYDMLELVNSAETIFTRISKAANPRLLVSDNAEINAITFTEAELWLAKMRSIIR